MATSTTKIPYIEGAAPATPATGEVVTYAKADGLMYSKDDAGTETLMSGGAGGGSGVATDTIWDAAGDLVQGTGANTAAKLSAGTAGQFLKSAGAAAANLWAFPPGYEFDYVAFTANVNVTATTEATANTLVTGSGVAYDGSTIVVIEFFATSVKPDSGAAGRSVNFWLYDGSSSIGNMGFVRTPAASNMNATVQLRHRLTPSNATHTYSIRASVDSGTGVVTAGAGGTATALPGFIRITKV